MWLLFGVLAIGCAIMNVVFTLSNKDAQWFRFLSLSFTALTVTAFYGAEATRVINEDWIGLMDVMPTVSTMLWVCVAASIAINSISLFKKTK